MGLLAEGHNLSMRISLTTTLHNHSQPGREGDEFLFSEQLTWIRETLGQGAVPVSMDHSKQPKA